METLSSRSSESQPIVRPSCLPQSRIREITVLSQSLGAVNLSQGFTDDDAPCELVGLLHEATNSRAGHQYADPRGTPLLRRNIAAKLRDQNGIEADPEREIIVTAGATEALMASFRSLFEPGDRLLTFAPAYENYFHQANAAGLSLEAITLAEPDFAVNAEDLDAAWSERVRGILICNPCNPTGKVFSRDELQLISEFARRRNLIILSDEAYESFIWKGTHVSIGSLPDARDRTVSIFSLGKTYSVTGWRVGYAAGPETLLRPISVTHELTTITASHPCQLALAHALELPSSFHAQQHRHYEKRKKLLTEALLGFGITPWDPAGSYFLWCDYALIADEPDSIFTERLMRVAGVAGVPGHVFLPRLAGNPKRIRFTFSKSLATINEAASRLASARLKLTA